ncbi:MAG: zinc-binding dehydrogenase [Chloroflexi bacterium RBG_13_46_14]|nr:MAG: zinc-binding dehydrogenase [Chloroflexi bacterium RBG_13_46_14]
MKAAVCYEYGKPLVVEELDMESPHKNEVKVKIAATAVCHSDLHFMSGDLPGALPFVPGHESAGYVDEVGEGVTNVKPGDRVVVSLLRSCGECMYCKTGRPSMCQATWPLDSESRLKNKKGVAVNHGLRVGSFAEYCMVDKSQVIPMPADMPMDRAALLACGVITGYGAVVNKAKVRPAESCVVIGVGGVGLNAIQGASISGAYPIIAVDMLDKKLEASRTFGSTHLVNASKGDPIEQVKKITGGYGADYVIITVGVTSAIAQGVAMLGRQGTVVIVGLATQNLEVFPMDIIDNEKVITASFMGTTNSSQDIPKLINLYKSGKLKLDELITAHYTLDQINEAVSSTASGEALRNIISFE